MKKQLGITAGLVHRLQSGTVDRNVSRDLLSFIAKTMRCNAYDTIPANRCVQFRLKCEHENLLLHININFFNLV